LEKKLDL